MGKPYKTGIWIEESGGINLRAIYGDNLVADIASSTAAKLANEFAWYVRFHRFDELFENTTGETKDSIGVYRKRGKNPVFIVKAGLRIRGSLNYLAGLYKGQAKSQSGKTFSYYKQRDLFTRGWIEFGGREKQAVYYQQMLEKRIKEAEA